VGVAGGFGGTTDSQVAVATLSMPTWIRDLTLLISPSYTKSKSIDSSQATQIDVEAYRVNIGVAYQITRYVSAFGGYEFVRQRTANSSTQQIDADQNRVRIGLQIGYPFSLD
jgi:predicted porin